MNTEELRFHILSNLESYDGDAKSLDDLEKVVPAKRRYIEKEVEEMLLESMIFQPQNGMYQRLDDAYLEELRDKVDIDSDDGITYYQVSNGRATTFQECKRKGWFQYVFIVVGAIIRSQYLKIGSIIHDLVEHVMELPKKKRKNELVKRLKKILNDIPESQQDEVKKPIMGMVDALLDIIDRYSIEAVELETSVLAKKYRKGSYNYALFKKILMREVERKDDYLGRYDNFDPDKFEGIGTIGYIDAVVLEDGKRILIDWKTGKMNFESVEKAKKQIQFYAHKERLIGRRVDGGKVVFLAHEGVEKSVDVSHAKCQEVFDEFIETFEKVFENGLALEYFPPTYSSLCYFCDFNLQCFEIDYDGILSNRFKGIVMELGMSDLHG